MKLLGDRLSFQSVLGFRELQVLGGIAELPALGCLQKADYSTMRGASSQRIAGLSLCVGLLTFMRVRMRVCFVSLLGDGSAEPRCCDQQEDQKRTVAKTVLHISCLRPYQTLTAS